MSPTHGLASTYRNQRSACRCDLCRAANTERSRLERAIRAARVDEVPPEAHGRLSTYKNWGCRCGLCTAANAVQSANYAASHPGYWRDLQQRKAAT